MSMIQFGSREMPDYAEYLPPSELRIGETYFRVVYADDDLVTPELYAYVFVGRDLQVGDVGKLYFQDYDSYRHGSRFDAPSADCETEIQCFLESQYSGVYDYEHALNELMKCSLRRQAANI